MNNKIREQKYLKRLNIDFTNEQIRPKIMCRTVSKNLCIQTLSLFLMLSEKRLFLKHYEESTQLHKIVFKIFIRAFFSQLGVGLFSKNYVHFSREWNVSVQVTDWNERNPFRTPLLLNNLLYLFLISGNATLFLLNTTIIKSNRSMLTF